VVVYNTVFAKTNTVKLKVVFEKKGDRELVAGLWFQ